MRRRSWNRGSPSLSGPAGPAGYSTRWPPNTRGLPASNQHMVESRLVDAWTSRDADSPAPEKLFFDSFIIEALQQVCTLVNECNKLLPLQREAVVRMVDHTMQK